MLFANETDTITLLNLQLTPRTHLSWWLPQTNVFFFFFFFFFFLKKIIIFELKIIKKKTYLRVQNEQFLEEKGLILRYMRYASLI